MTTALTHPTLAALLEAIRANPDEGTTRLALAEWYEESGDPARAEFIRVQVEMARVGFRNCNNPQCSRGTRQPPMNWCVKCLEWNDVRQPLQARSDALLAEHEARWRRGERCGRCENGRVRHSRAGGMDTNCLPCRGTGWERWWLMKSARCDHDGTVLEWRHRVHFDRGLITQVDANLRDIMDEYGKATEWALACVRGEPGLRRLWPMDRTPYDFDVDDGMRYGWHPADNYQVDEPDHIPRKLFDMIFKRVKEWEEATYFDTLAAASLALGEAAWRVVSGQA